MLKNFNCFLSGLIDILDSDGGHLVILMILTIVFVRNHADAYLDLTIGALIMKLKDAGSNKNREAKYTPNGSVMSATEVVKTTPDTKENQ